ncbi:MAG: helix-turn-helix domain-containing protein [Acutalibacteraceae bacterium]
MELGKKIKQLRTNKGVTQEALANALGVTCQAVSRWKNETTMPDISLLPQISVFFGVSID